MKFRLGRVLALVALVGVVVGWAVFLRPQSLGGNVAYVIVSGESMEPRLHDGDLVVAVRQSSYRVGDVVTYRVPEGEVGAGAQVIHRVIGGSAATGYIVKGDNRRGQDVWRPKPKDVVGKMRFDVPRVGRVVGLVQTPLGMGIVAALAALIWVLGGPANAKRARAGDEAPRRRG